eukprot:GFUD01133263.1.p1 GENE.GFUD01133263.1~~GFUD01133263.1.p1  ORF type:complete len:866 (+),score=189.92 GFUD01133263.1:273-2600(+)
MDADEPEMVAQENNENAEASGNTSTNGQRDRDLRRRHNLDIALLSRHIDHMQRICRASLTDLTLSRQRRQIIRLQGIRRMLEDLQRQIRQLQASSENPAAGTSQEDPQTATPDPPPTRTSFSLGPCMSRYQQLRSRTSTGLPRPSRSSNILANRSRLSRAHNQLVSQLRATFRAMEMSPDLAQRGISPVSDSMAEASQNVLEQTETTSTRPLPSSLTSTSGPILVTPSATTSNISTPTDVVSVARNDLRSMSQRLERLLRERREVMERLGEMTPTNEQQELDTERELERRTLDIIDARMSRGPGVRRGPQTLTDNLLDSSSPSDSEEERAVVDTRDIFTRHSASRIPVRHISRRDEAASTGSSRTDLLDYYDHDSYLRNRRVSSSVGAASGDSWRPLSMRERLDIRAGLRRETERERARLSRERDLSIRRMRYRSEMVGNSSERLPPLRELIWRRLRRRTGAGEDEEEPLAAAGGSTASTGTSTGSGGSSTRDRSRHREILSWMVDQLTIDHEGEADQLEPTNIQGPSGALGGASVPTPPPAADTTNAGTGAGPAPRYQHGRFRDWGREDNAWTRGPDRRPPFREYHFMHHTPSNIALTHRIQTWDFCRGDIPDISVSEQNIVVKEAKIHNDASVDISEDGSLLVTLVPSNLPMTTVVGLYSLRKGNLGDCYATYSLESSAVSVSLSPTSRHLLVGLTSRTSRIISLSPVDRQLMAQVFRIKLPGVARERGRLIHRRDINQVDYGHMSLNCIRWIPVAGQGIVFATNTGLLKILR